MTAGELIRILQHYPSGTIVYCNEQGRYDDRREILEVYAAIGRKEVFLEYKNV